MTHIEIARTYINKKEKPGNSGFQDPDFESEMKSLGEWIKGFSWCACFTQLVFRKAYPERSAELKKLFDPSTRTTFNNFKSAGHTISDKPFLGALVIWSNYKDGKQQWEGHAGIVSKVIDDHTFMSIEGNTSGAGSRNGDRVFEHTRTTGLKENGLSVIGFITI